MIDIMRLLDHCTRFGYINTNLCDYGRQCALIAALVLKRRGGYTLDCEVNLTGDPLPVELVTDGQMRHLSNGFVGQWFKMVVRGHRQMLEAEFVVNFQSVPRVFTGLAEIAHTANEIFLPRDLINLVVSFEEQGRFEEESAKFGDPIFLRAAIDHVNDLQRLAGLIEELEMTVLEDLLHSDPLAAIQTFGPDRVLQYLTRHLG